MTFPIDDVRAAFPSLAITDGGMRRIYLDNPAGTQVPQTVADATARCLIESNANLGGFFVTSERAETTIDRARERMRVFLNAQSAREVVVGPSMTALTFRMARALARTWNAGDEIVVTRMDHDGNIAPWLTVAQERGLKVRWVDFDLETWRIEPSALDDALNGRTRLVAITYASNLTGSVNDIAALVKRIHEAGALAYVDAVQFAPHGCIDVQRLDCDFLACSSYKFFGPHLGIVYGRESLLEALQPDKVRPSTNDLPWRFELGTPQIELFAALDSAVGYFEWLGGQLGARDDARARIERAFEAASAYERELSERLIEGLRRQGQIRILGITDARAFSSRVPTVSFLHSARSPEEIATDLGRRGVFVWSGNNYALELVRTLGIPVETGVVRIGAAHYNTPAEIDAALEYLAAANKTAHSSAL